MFEWLLRIYWNNSNQSSLIQQSSRSTFEGDFIYYWRSQTIGSLLHCWACCATYVSLQIVMQLLSHRTIPCICVHNDITLSSLLPLHTLQSFFWIELMHICIFSSFIKIILHVRNNLSKLICSNKLKIHHTKLFPIMPCFSRRQEKAFRFESVWQYFHLLLCECS